ncbi:MAG: SOS response-associated peptidase [Flammeovirgaceae bacterium]
MCGRYTLAKTLEEVRDRFKVKDIRGTYSMRWNAAPSQFLPVIASSTVEAVSFFRWGLIPSWSKEISIAYHTINARIESIFEKPAFQYAIQHQRCLVIADGYYEWKTIGKEKIPYYICLDNHELFSMAGIWDVWNSPKGEPIHSFSILTIPSTSKIRDIHDRMPVILRKDQEKNWISDIKITQNQLDELVVSSQNQHLKAFTVSKKVNSVETDSPDLILPVTHKVQGSLF